jgi:hypothetical protein
MLQGKLSRSQWPCCLMHESYSFARTLGSRVRILCDELITRPRSPTVCAKKDYETEVEARAQRRAVDPLMNDSKENCHLQSEFRVVF